MQNKLKK